MFDVLMSLVVVALCAGSYAALERNQLRSDP